MMTIYHNPRCKKSRAGLAYLQEKGIDPKIVTYLKDEVLTPEIVTDLLAKLKKEPTDIIRTQEKEYKEHFKGKDFSRSEWINILVKHPRLIKRPIITDGTKAVLGDPVEAIAAIL
ncbi:MAG: arsenate reductase (glutaredoxin) [Bacteroidota bacterium]|jgi:arsenate reductase